MTNGTDGFLGSQRGRFTLALPAQHRSEMIRPDSLPGVAEMKKWPDEIGDIAGQGNFESGLVQTFVLTPEWMRKAALIQVWVANRSH